MRQGVTNIRLEQDTASIMLGSGYGITIKSDGSIRIENPTSVAVLYRPSRLENTSKATNPFITPEGERTESEQVIKVENNLMLELRTSRVENHLRADVLFRIITDGETTFSGLFVDWVDGDWTIGFRRVDDFLLLLDKLFSL